jgi:hypothetical protein
MGVADLVGQDGNNPGAAPGEPVLSRVMLIGVVWVRIPFAVSLTADAPDKPGIGVQSIVQRFEKAPASSVFRR